MNDDMNGFNDDFLHMDVQPVVPFGLQLFNNALVPVPDQLVRAQDGTIELQFSTLESLLNLISNANPEMYKFSKKLLKIEKTQDMKHLDSEIIRVLDRSLKTLFKRNLVLSVVHSVLKKKSSNIADFYCGVLSVFMLNTPLPKNLNKCLKSGYFSQNDCWVLPYLICLCQAFFCQTLNLNYIDINPDPQPVDLYQVLEVDEEAFRQRGIGEKIAMKEFAFFKTQKPLKRERKARICLHLEIPAEITKNLKHSVYLELSPNRILFVHESNRAILAPGCEFVVSEISLDEELDATMIKLKIACKTEPKIGLRVETENHATSDGLLDPRNNSNFWNMNYDQWGLNE